MYRNSMASVKIDKHFGAKCFGKKSMDYQKFYTRLGIGNHMTKPFAWGARFWPNVCTN